DVVKLEARMKKIPQITLAFWIIKICATTLGESGGDLLSMTLRLGYAVSALILIGLLALALVSQLRSKTYHPSLYWSVILLTSTAGTTMSDYMDRTLGLGYTKGSLILCTILLAIFVLWLFISGLLALVVFATFFSTISKTLLFWFAFVLTRPFGATMGDLLTKTKVQGGLGFGTIGTSLILASITIIFILYTSRSLIHTDS